MDAAGHEITMEMPAYACGQAIHLLRDLLHKEKTGMLPPDQADDIVEGGPGEAEQIPTDKFDHCD
jgi:hypothetical protein